MGGSATARALALRALRRCLFSGHDPPDPPAGLLERTALIGAFYERQASALSTQAASTASLHARDHRARLDELRSIRRQRDGQQRVADKEIGLRHIVDADMPADFLIKIYHLKN